jgi:NET1-associated nuclear protein 1 (U3 small nucleolar RNA-associated protein 17)
MAGSRSTKSREDGTKKRKRDIIEADQDTKRHRKEQKARKAEQAREKPAGSEKTESSLQKASKTELAPLAQSKTTVLKPTENAASSWKISKPMGGRMLDIDPILTEDEG